MKPSLIHFLATLALLALHSPASAATPYSSFFSDNGSFELGTGSPPLEFASNFSSTAEITGWSLYASGAVPMWLEDGNAQDGNRYIELSSVGGLASWTSSARIDSGFQNPGVFVAGESYELSFWGAGGIGSNNSVSLIWYNSLGFNGQTVDIPDYTQTEFDALGGLEWVQYRVPFTATDSVMNLAVNMPTARTFGVNNTVYLDNFSIVAVPEPGGLMLALLGLSACLVRRRPVKRSVAWGS
jgi:hypothetical protein